MALKIGIILLTVATFALVAVFFLTASSSMLPQMSVTIGKIVIPAEVVSTPMERQRGLSGREALQEGSGMLFIFEEEGDWGIWMKEMNFSIDIIWARSDGVITTVIENVSPETYPETYFPKTPDAKYVLELPSGFVKANGIQEGEAMVVNANAPL